MKTIRKLAVAIALMAVLSLSFAVRGDPSQWGLDSAVTWARHVNEYEGQHRLAVAAGGSKNGEVPVVSG